MAQGSIKRQEMFKVLVVSQEPDVKVLCSLTKCKQSNLNEYLLHRQPILPNRTVINRMVSEPVALHSYSQWAMKTFSETLQNFNCK